MNSSRIRAAVATCIAVCVAALPFLSSPLAAQDVSRTASALPLSLDQAVRSAEAQSPTLRLAQGSVRRAQGQVYQARSQYFPQLNASAGYTRTLRSQFSALARSTPQPAQPVLPAVCAPFISDSATAAERNAALAQATTCASDNGGINFSSVGFGAKNQYNFGLAGSQSLFTGGRVAGQNEAAAAGRRAAEIELSAQRAQLRLDVTQAYYDAALADRLLAIAQASLSQAERLLQQTRLTQQVGNTSEFELLRATVARDNQRPVVIQRQSDREVAYLRLKQLIDLPLEQVVTLTTPVEDSVAAPPGVDLARAESPDTAASNRATVREADESVRAQRGLLRVARAQRLPSLALTSQYGRVAFPAGGFPSLGNFRTNWTVSLGTTLPIFTGGRIRGDELIAEANLSDAKARLQQTRQLAALDSRIALNALQQAEATLGASRGTAEQATRAFSIAEVRYREGISTQLELTDARNLLQQALANRAQAARNVQVARVKLALLPDLPLQITGAGQSGALQQQQQQQQQQQMQQQAPQGTQGQQGQQGQAGTGTSNPTGQPGSGF